jgi:hypothetical protein
LLLLRNLPFAATIILAGKQEAELLNQRFEMVLKPFRSGDAYCSGYSRLIFPAGREKSEIPPPE